MGEKGNRKHRNSRTGRGGGRISPDRMRRAVRKLLGRKYKERTGRTGDRAQEDNCGRMPLRRAEAKPSPSSFGGRTMHFFWPSDPDAPLHMTQPRIDGISIRAETSGLCSSFLCVTHPRDFSYRDTGHGKTCSPVFPLYNNVSHSCEIGKAEYLSETGKWSRENPSPGLGRKNPLAEFSNRSVTRDNHSSDRRF